MSMGRVEAPAPAPEERQKTVRAAMVRHYGIAPEPEPPCVRPRDPEWAFKRSGYSEENDRRRWRPRFVPAAIRLALRLMPKPRPAPKTETA